LLEISASILISSLTDGVPFVDEVKEESR